MRSTITQRGQTVIPAEIRHQFGSSPGDRLEWVVQGGQIHMGPVRAYPIDAFRGHGRGRSTHRLLAGRRKDAADE